jgi:hypothetical protein
VRWWAFWREADLAALLKDVGKRVLRINCWKSAANVKDIYILGIERNFYQVNSFFRGTRWRSWLMQCATSRKNASSIPGGVIGNFHLHNSSGRTVAPGLARPLQNQEYFLRSKGGRCLRLITLPHSCADYLEIWEPKLLETSGPVQACNGIALPFIYILSLFTKGRM